MLLIIPILLGLLLLAGYLACKKRPIPPPEEESAVGEGHGNVRTYKDDGAGEEDNFNYDLKHLMTFMYIQGRGGSGEVEHEHASVRNYAEEGVAEVDSQRYDIHELMRYR